RVGVSDRPGRPGRAGQAAPQPPRRAGPRAAREGGGPMSLVVVMGVTGCGKSTVGIALARRLGVPFADADDFHSQENVAKMAAGAPLDDADRGPWLHAIGAWLAEHAEHGAVASCSALKRAYRDVLREHAPDAFFVHLHG